MSVRGNPGERRGMKVLGGEKFVAFHGVQPARQHRVLLRIGSRSVFCVPQDFVYLCQGVAVCASCCGDGTCDVREELAVDQHKLSEIALMCTQVCVGRL